MEALYRRMKNATLHTAGTTLRSLDFPESCMLPLVKDPLLPWLRKLVPDPYASAPLAPYSPTCWGIWNEGQSPAPLPPSPTVEQTRLVSVAFAHSVSGESEASLITVGITLSDKLRCRLRRGEAAVPNTLAALRFKYNLNPEPAQWPDGAPVQVLLRLHKLLDEDDAIRDMYASALQADVDDACMPGTYAAKRAAELLNDPDPVTREWVQYFPLSDDICRCICLGLIPSGLWSAIASHIVTSRTPLVCRPRSAGC